MPHVFAKLAIDLHRNPKVRKAGRLGREVFIFCLCVNADRGATGRLPAEYLEPWFLADALQISEEEAREGLERAVAARLIDMRPDMSGHLVGWDDEEWGRSRAGSMTEAERKQAQRDRSRNRKEKHSTANVRTPVRTVSGRPDHSESESEAESDLSDQRIPPAREPMPEPGLVDPDPNATERKRLLALLVPMHVAAFNLVRAELGSSVPVMQPMGDPAERALQAMLRDRVSLAGAEEECRHVLAVRIQEARRTRTVKYLGAAVWNPISFAKAKAMEVDEAGAPAPAPAGPRPGPQRSSGLQALFAAGAARRGYGDPSDPDAVGPDADDPTNPNKRTS